MVAVPEGTAVLGKPENFPSFGWDNEYGKRVRRALFNIILSTTAFGALFKSCVRAGSCFTCLAYAHVFDVSGC